MSEGKGESPQERHLEEEEIRDRAAHEASRVIGATLWVVLIISSLSALLVWVAPQVFMAIAKLTALPTALLSAILIIVYYLDKKEGKRLMEKRDESASNDSTVNPQKDD